MDTGTDKSLTPYQLDFFGKTSEYFRIWIVNLTLSILTLGIYSAWAKVRTNRYFYGSTQLAGSSFQYLADPVKILRGRLIAFLLLVIYLATTNFVPWLEFVFIIIFFIILPWILNQALAFRARNSAYRNIRFGYSATYGEAAGVFVGWFLLAYFTAMILYPYFAFKKANFIATHSSYGQQKFGFDAKPGDYFAVYALAVLGGFILLIVFSVLVGMTIFNLESMVNGEDVQENPVLLQFVFMGIGALFLPIYLFLWSYVEAKSTNLFWNNASSGEHTFTCELRTGKLFWIYLSNTIGIILSAGMLIPWAKIRMARYKLTAINVMVAGSLDEYIANEQQAVAATSEGMSDVFDFDIGL